MVGLDWAKPMMQFSLHVTCSCIPMHTFLLFNILWYIWTSWDFFYCIFLPLSLSSVYISASMAPKRKFAPSRNPFCSGESSSFDPTSSFIWFRDKDAQKNFSENFSRRGIHSERWVILSNFSDTDLPTIIHSWGWKSLCDISVTCPSVLI